MSFQQGLLPNPYPFRSGENLEQDQGPPNEQIEPEEDPFAQYASSEEDPFDQYSVPSEKEKSMFEKFGQALSFQARSNVVEDLRALTPIISGATFGASEKVSGFEIPEEYPEDYVNFMKNVGSVAPVEALFFLNKPLVKLAQKSPIFKTQLSSLAKIVQSGLVGAELEGITHIIEKGELPSEEDVLAHGAQWAALDAALQLAGAAGRFGKKLLSKSKSLGEGPFKILNDLIMGLENKGIEFEGDLNKVSEAALKQLEQLEVPQKGKKIELPVQELTKPEKVAQKSIEDFEVTAKSLEDRKVEEKFFDRIEDIQYEEPSKPIVQSAEDLEKDIAKDYRKEELDQFLERPETEQEAGREIKRKVNDKFTAAKEEYDQLYAKARENIENITAETTGIANSIENSLNKLEQIKTKPEGYTKVISTLKTSLEDIGFPIEVNMETGRIKLIKGSLAEVPLSNLMELGVRLGEIVDFNVIEPSVKNALKPVRSQIKQTIRDVLESKDPQAFKFWTKAETKYGETANKFRKPSIIKIRKQYYNEEIPKEVIRPTATDDLKEVLGEKDYKHVEREILEDIRTSPTKGAIKQFNELKSKLSPEAQKIAKDIISSKAKPLLRNSKQLEFSIADALSKPGRPKTLIDYWKTREGNIRMREALRKNPNKDQIIQYFQKQSVHDFGNQFLDSSGKIDFKAFQNSLKKETNLRVIRDIGGQDAVNFFKKLASSRQTIEQHVKQFESRINRDLKSYRTQKEFYDKAKESLKKAKTPKEKTIGEKVLKSSGERLKQTKKSFDDQYGGVLLHRLARKELPGFFKFEEMISDIGIPGKTILGLTGVQKLGLGKTATLAFLGRFIYKVAKKKSLQEKIKKGMLESKNYGKFIAFLKDFDFEEDEE